MVSFNAETELCWRHRRQQKPFRFVIQKLLYFQLLTHFTVHFYFLQPRVGPGQPPLSLRFPISSPSFSIFYFNLAVLQWPNGNMPDCSVRGPRFESHRGQLCLSRQPLRYTALGTGCTPLLHCLDRLSLPPSVRR